METQMEPRHENDDTDDDLDADEMFNPDENYVKSDSTLDDPSRGMPKPEFLGLILHTCACWVKNSHNGKYKQIVQIFNFGSDTSRIESSLACSLDAFALDENHRLYSDQQFLLSRRVVRTTVRRNTAVDDEAAIRKPKPDTPELTVEALVRSVRLTSLPISDLSIKKFCEWAKRTTGAKFVFVVYMSESGVKTLGDLLANHVLPIEDLLYGATYTANAEYDTSLTTTGIAGLPDLTGLSGLSGPNMSIAHGLESALQNMSNSMSSSGMWNSLVNNSRTNSMSCSIMSDVTDSGATNQTNSRTYSKPNSRPNSRPNSQPNSRTNSRPTSKPESRPNSRPESKPNSRPHSNHNAGDLPLGASAGLSLPSRPSSGEHDSTTHSTPHEARPLSGLRDSCDQIKNILSETLISTKRRSRESEKRASNSSVHSNRSTGSANTEPRSNR
ncbi:PARP [Apis mellifera filamentous virus]|nr:PARP [Apis mellifera filamentous virus]WOK43414.1 MAG: hypothetical protein [Apis mellifera filamentous virus]